MQACGLTVGKEADTLGGSIIRHQPNTNTKRPLEREVAEVAGL